jgi:Tol biopolymer transport system component/DNA-binding winged helix-turn-helix (wHTH) protein
LNLPIQPSYGFGEFRLDVAERRLLRSGVEVPLAPKVFDTLVLLVENAGHLLEKDELMKRLWPDTFVGEVALARNISILRKSFGQNGESQEMIETVPTRGYRFVAVVRHIELSEAPATSVQVAAAPPVGAEPAAADQTRAHGAVGSSEKPIYNLRIDGSNPRPRHTSFIIIAIAVGALAGLATFWLLSPAPGLRVTLQRRLTTASRLDPWGMMVSDGSRIYYLEREGDYWNLVQTSVSGGESQIVPAPFQNTRVVAISPDHASFLIASFIHRGDRMPLWIWPVQGGAPKRLGDVSAYDGGWRPNGRQILYSEDDGIYQIDVDGTNAHRFVATDGPPGLFAWSPDGRFLRFTVGTQQPLSSALWEVDSDGTHLHRLLPGWDTLPEECCGVWSADGKYFFFSSHHGKTSDVWVIQERMSALHRPEEPVRLTTGPVDFLFPVPSMDGRRLFVIGDTHGRNELVRYDLLRRQFSPMSVNTSVLGVAFSRDGAWIAYVSSQDSTLVRVKADGSQPLVLTPTTLPTKSLSWSPDGTQLAFSAVTPSGVSKIFVVPAGGGTPRELFEEDHFQDEPVWSSDGRSIAFSRFEEGAASSSSIQVLNLATKQVSLLSGSDGLRSPSWSPDAHFLAAITENLQKVMLLDLHTQKWTELADATLLNGALTWSKDGKDLYYQDLLGKNQPVYRIHLADRKREVVTTFETFLKGGVHRAALMGLTPDGSLIVRLDRGGADIYALDLDLP